MPDLGSIEFKWPFMLWALGVWPLWMGWRWWRHRGSSVLAQGWRPAAGHSLTRRVLEAASLGLLLLALARPQAVVLQPMRDAAVMLVMDVSVSMKADDVKPNRLDAARDAARYFIHTKPGLLQVGIVAVGGTATLAQVPTLQREDLLLAIDDLSWQNGSALGTGVLIALDTLLPKAGIDAQKIIDDANDAKPRPGPPGAAVNPTPPVAKNPSDPPRDPQQQPTPEGANKAIILITDGEGNMGPTLSAMADLAAKHQVRVHVIGVGTPQGAIVRDKGVSTRTQLEEEGLRKVALNTRGEYRRAEDVTQFKRLYDDLGRRMKFEKRGVSEITHLLGCMGMALGLLAAALGLSRAGHLA
ncbi:MAG: hypothetical protein RIT26_981 [Pseudomonadota bacterium]|jgi:Ca-activated chloride channel family protein